MQRDRGILTLNFKKTKKDNDATSYTNDTKAQIAERQRLLKEAQAKKSLENKQKNRPKPNFEKNDNLVKEVDNDKQKNNVECTNNIDNIKVDQKNTVNNNSSSGENKDFEKNREKYENKNQKDNDKNFKKNKFNDKNKKDFKKFNKNDKKEDSKDDGKDEKKGDNRGYRNEDKNNKNKNGKNVEDNNLNSIAKAQADITTQQNAKIYKDNKVKGKNSDYDDGNNTEKINKKITKDKSEKYSKNIHTFIFNDDDGNDDLRHFYKNKRKNKKNDENNQHFQQKIFKTVNIPDLISISDLADRMNEKRADIIKKLFTMGIKATVNQIVDADTAELVVIEFGHTPNRVSDSDIESILNNDEGKEFVERSPVVTVMGHVDHGKTSLLDALRTTKVVESESGGITQHIGASKVDCGDGKFITFIDTPGHEAFTEMRIRGANITDIVVLVVAADDGVKDQTVEAINHTKAAKVPMIVAVNKIDKEHADPERVKQELLNYDVVAEEFGGDVMFVNVSAKNHLNLDKLLDAILLQAEILDLKAPIDCRARGVVIESKVDQKQGVVATVLVQAGILKVGDIILAGTSYGKVKKMVDNKRKSQDKAGPSVAVEILGFDNSPGAGEIFNVVSIDKEARDIVSYRERKLREAKEAKRSKNSESLLQQVKGSNKKQLSIILKCDVSGSVEAIAGSLLKLNDNEEVSVNIIHSAVGSITETDVNLASASNAIIIGFNVRGSNNVKDLAKEKDIKINYYSIIYNIVDDVKTIMSGLLKPVEKEKVTGQAEIRNIIKISGIGTVAGCYVLDGEIRRNSSARLIRDGIVIFNTKIKTLKRFKDDVKEVKANYECGISLENYDDIKERDIIECYDIIEEKRTL